jgi:phage virion morphogenesis protein
MISFEYNDEAIRRVLDAFVRAAANPAPVLKGIGETLTQSTKERFKTSTGPDGASWEANTEATMAAYLAKFSGAYKKNGDLSKRGERISARKKPLIGETKSLSTQIHYELVGDTELHIGSPMEYDAMQQFGGTKAQFPNLWGDIPARPFMGVSEQDRADILSDLADYLNAALRG